LKSIVFYGWSACRRYREYILENWFNIYGIIYKAHYRYINRLHRYLFIRALRGKRDSLGLYYLCYVFLGRVAVKGAHTNLHYKLHYMYEPIYNYMVNRRYSSYLLFSGSNAFLHNQHDLGKWLKVQKFNHSTKLEYIYGSYSLGIIGCIVVPSVYLLYSSEVSVSPSITIKVIGHQWY